MMELGTFFGIGVGPGPSGFIPVAALTALKSCQVVFVPKAQHVSESIARQCARDLEIPPDVFREVVYDRDWERQDLPSRYTNIAQEIACELRAGKDVAYLTTGDALTYSTLSFTLQALVNMLPEVKHRIFPGVTSYAAAAAALDWPIGRGKERTLILPCPDDIDRLRTEIDTHDIVILLKISDRLPAVLQLLHEMGISQHCALCRPPGSTRGGSLPHRCRFASCRRAGLSDHHVDSQDIKTRLG